MEFYRYATVGLQVLYPVIQRVLRKLSLNLLLPKAAFVLDPRAGFENTGEICLDFEQLTN